MPTLREIIFNIRIEPFVFLLTFAYHLEDDAINDLIHDKICRNNYNVSPDTCLDLTTSKSEWKDDIIADVSTFNLIRVLMTAIPMVIIAVFVGPWADKHQTAGRLLMGFAAAAGAAESILLVVNSVWFGWNPILVLTSFVPSSLLGGTFAGVMTVYAYVAMTTDSTEDKLIRFSIVDACQHLGDVVGTYLFGILVLTTPIGFDKPMRNYAMVFLIGFMLKIFALLWIIFGHLENSRIKEVDETKYLLDPAKVQFKYEDEAKPRISDIFKMRNAKEMFKTMFQPRTDHRTTKIWLFLLAAALITIAVDGPGYIRFEYNAKFFQIMPEIDWVLDPIYLIISTITVIIVVPLLVSSFKINNLNEIIIFTSTGCVLIDSLINGTLPFKWAFYGSLFFRLLSYLPVVAIRSFLGWLIHRSDEHHRVFSLLTIIETLVPIAAGLLFETLFWLTSDSQPAVVFWINSGIVAISIEILVVIKLIK